jgi:hypothetical protein
MSTESERYELLEELHRVEQECFKRDAEIARLTKAEREQRDAASSANAKLVTLVSKLRVLTDKSPLAFARDVEGVLCDVLRIDRNNFAFREWIERKNEDISWDPYCEDGCSDE